jgi:hypothetical protein
MFWNLIYEQCLTTLSAKLMGFKTTKSGGWHFTQTPKNSIGGIYYEEKKFGFSGLCGAGNGFQF